MPWIWLVGCGEPLTCGPGTEEVDHQCVPVAQGDDDDDDDDDLTGDTAAPGADLVVEPASLVFDPLDVPCSARRELSLENVGGAPVVVEGVTVESADGAFSLGGSATFPVELAPGASLPLSVEMVATIAGAAAGVLTVATDRPDTPTVTVSLTGERGYAGTRQETFRDLAPQVDLILLIDQSCSMEDDNFDDVSQGLPLMIDALDEVSDWRVAEVTALDGCATRFVDRDTPDASRILVDNAFTGVQHALTEALLELGDLALGATAPGGCNEGFLRPGAQLLFLLLSDEAEQSGTPWRQWVDRYRAYDPEVVISGVLDVNFNCGEGAAGYVEAVADTGGLELNICTPDWGSDLVGIADLIHPSAAVAGAVLAEEPIVDTLAVSVNGVPATSFVYEPTTRAVEHIVPLPGPSDVVTVDYAVPSTCD